MLRYFPFFEAHDASMGIRPYVAHDSLIEIDEHYSDEVQLKHTLLDREHSFYYRAQPQTMLAQWEVVALLLDDMARTYPEQFKLDRQADQWTWQNALLGETTTFRYEDAASLPYEPLDWVGRQVQEDLVLLSPDVEARLVGGQLCFPNGWSLESKWDQPFLEVHKPSPKVVDPTIQTANKLMQRLRPDRPVWRASWNFRLSTDLDMSNRETARVIEDFARRVPHLTPENIGEQLWLRIERQSFVKLPRSQHTLFLIHTYQSPLESEASDPDRARRMHQTIRTVPRTLLDYRSITPIEDVLLTYLEGRIQG